MMPSATGMRGLDLLVYEALSYSYYYICVRMQVMDFYLHDVQHSRPMLGIAPPGALRRDFEVSIVYEALSY